MTPEDLDYWYQERAGILEHMGGLPNEKAEALARAEMESHLNAIEKAREGKE